MKDSKIHNHSQGGIHIWGEKENNIKIMNNMILNNKTVGLNLFGPGSDPIVEGNFFEGNCL